VFSLFLDIFYRLVKPQAFAGGDPCLAYEFAGTLAPVAGLFEASESKLEFGEAR
jgi:hypothetical protein